METKHCKNCERDLPLTEEFFYPNRKKDRIKVGWQSYCKDCWPKINKANKAARKEMMRHGGLI